MAQLNVLCVDKTGTLTDEKIVFEKLEVIDSNVENLPELVAIAAKETSNGSSTSNSIIDALKTSSDYKILETLPFSSARKMSGVKISLNKKVVSLIIGAPEYIAKIATVSNETQKQVDKLTSVGKRVLLVSIIEDSQLSIKKLDSICGHAVGYIVLANELRQGVTQTVEFLQKNGVEIKVISGDNLKTVSYIAKKAGIKNYDKVITGIDLQAISDNNWDKTVQGTTIFARVLPEQKERLIETYKKLGYYTGMVGDGVNDALALKKSDFGVAMYAGASASRRVADVVILDNSFNSLPLGMKLGNRIMQAIEMIATLFFHKIIFGVVLLLSTILIGLVYPFEPRHVTFMNIFLVTIPTILWTLLPPIPKHRLSPKRFWHMTLMSVAPIAFMSGLMVAISYVFLSILHPGDATGVSTTTVMIATFFGIYLVFLVPKMFEIKNNRKARIARILYVLLVVAVMLPSFGFGFIREFFNFSTPAWHSAWPLMVVIIGVAVIQWKLAVMAGKRLEKS